MTDKSRIRGGNLLARALHEKGIEHVFTLAGVLIGAAALLVPGANFGGSAAEALPAFKERRQFDGVYEPSGLTQLPDGRVLVVEDEKAHPISILTLDDSLTMSAEPLPTTSLFAIVTGRPSLGEMEDLEAVDTDDNGFVYAITSHSRKASGKRNDAREKLVRFRVDGDELAEPDVLTDLRKAMGKVDKELKDAAKISDVKDDNGFNIEGLSFSKTKEELLIGLRSPVIDGQGVIVVMRNPVAAFEKGETPVFADDPIYLDLDQGGIRSIAYDPKLGGYLIVSRREKKGEDVKVWLWDGLPGHRPRRIRIDDTYDLSNAEGITPLRQKGSEWILIVFDTGGWSKRKDGYYLLLAYDQLEVDPILD
jgi:hypothetical protein